MEGMEISCDYVMNYAVIGRMVGSFNCGWTSTFTSDFSRTRAVFWVCVYLSFFFCFVYMPLSARVA